MRLGLSGADSRHYRTVGDGKLIKIRVSEAAKRVLESTAKDLDMKEIGVASRVVEWFGRQDQAVRNGVLGFWPSLSEAEIAERIAGPRGGKAKGK